MALSKLTILNERYVLRNNLGDPGLYDTTYLAWNLMKKETAVVVREFNPTFLMSRSKNGENLIPTSGPAEQLFGYGLNCFIREADATGLIQHPNVIHQQTYFRENDTAYSVSAYHPGATLDTVLQGQEGKLQERAAFAIIVPLLDGLVAGHRKGLIHGRLSPSQVFLTKSGRPMLLRFHVTQILLARRCGRASDIAAPGFTPPELLLADGKKGPWSDVYASGATLYSIITGKRPPQAMKRFDRDPFPDILHKEADISKGLKVVLNRAMATDSNDRQQTIQELKQEILEQMPATSRPYTPAVELKVTMQENSAEQEIELQKAKSTAKDIAILSREALANSPLKVSEPVPLSLEEIDSQRANQWLPDLKESNPSGDGIPFRNEHVVETNPLGPLASEITYLEPITNERAITAHEISQEITTSSFKQVVNSATANSTRKLSMAVITACIFLFIPTGIWNRMGSGAGGELPHSVQAANSIATAPVVPPQTYMLLLAKADSLQQLAHTPLLANDTLRRTQLYAEANDVYQEVLLDRPADSLIIAKMLRLNALTQAFEIKSIQVTASTKSIAPSLSDDDEIEIAARQKEFQSLIRRGERFLKTDLLDEARQAFTQALTLIPNANSALVRLSNVGRLIEKREEGERQFQDLKNQGDELLAQRSYSAALISYETALLLRPDDLIIEEQINAVKDGLKALETTARQHDSQYASYKQTADSLFDAGNMNEALSFYRITQVLKPEDVHVQERMTAINKAKSEKENLPVDEEGIFLIPNSMPKMVNNTSVIEQIVYPAKARRKGIEGMVIVKILVDEKGETSRMEILKGIGSGCDQEALRVLQKAKFLPATYKGNPVKSWHTHPIKFKILKK